VSEAGSGRAGVSWWPWSSGRSPGEATPGAGSPGAAVGTKALAKFVSVLAGKEAPVLLDLGPVVGANVAFFGERLGCKIFVEDLYGDLERLSKARKLDELPTFLEGRFDRPDGSVEGVLCWDLFDYLARPAAEALAGRLTRLLRPDGVLLAFFSTLPPGDPQYTKYRIVDETHLEQSAYPASCPRQPALANRDIGRLFDGLVVAESFLLLTKTREMLFRKPLGNKLTA